MLILQIELGFITKFVYLTTFCFLENFELICYGMREFGPTVRFWLGSDMFVGTTDLELIEVGIFCCKSYLNRTIYPEFYTWISSIFTIFTHALIILSRRKC